MFGNRLAPMSRLVSADFVMLLPRHGSQKSQLENLSKIYDCECTFPDHGVTKIVRAAMNGQTFYKRAQQTGLLWRSKYSSPRDAQPARGLKSRCQNSQNPTSPLSCFHTVQLHWLSALDQLMLQKTQRRYDQITSDNQSWGCTPKDVFSQSSSGVWAQYSFSSFSLDWLLWDWGWCTEWGL